MLCHSTKHPPHFVLKSSQRVRDGIGGDSVVSPRRGKFFQRKGRGSGVFEYRIDFGPGYRKYFSKDGEALVICLAAVQSGGNSRQFPLDFVLKKSIDEPLLLD